MTSTLATRRVTGTLVSRSNVSLSLRDDMFALLDRHFAGVTREQFALDLNSKNWVLTLHDDAGALVGFSTLLVYETAVDGQTLSVVCSGDTIVDPSAWASAALPREWIAAVNRLRALYPNGPYYWLLISSGLRTYRLLPTFWREFWPRFDASTPPASQRLLSALAHQLFGEQFDPATGVVRLRHPQRLRPHLLDCKRDDPHVAFFALKNPGHLQGDELVCLCELADANLSRAGRRVVYGPGANR